MGLAEKRAVDTFKNSEYTEFLGKLKTILGRDVPVETNWDELTKRIEGYSGDISVRFKDYFENMFSKSILTSFSAICVDNMGKEAVASILKKIIIKSDENASASEKGFKFEDGILSANMSYTNTDEVNLGYRTEALQKILEKNL